MKKKCIAAAALAALLMCALAGMAIAAAAPPLTTEVSVSFVDAIYFEEFPDGGGMDIDFGEQRMPRTDKTGFIFASDGPHTLRVCDTRDVAGKWYVSAQLTPMTSEENSFRAQFNFYTPTFTDGLVPNYFVPYPVDFVRILPDGAEHKIMDADENLLPGNFDFTVAMEDTQMGFNAPEAALVKPLTYTATVTWTLTQTP